MKKGILVAIILVGALSAGLACGADDAAEVLRDAGAVLMEAGSAFDASNDAAAQLDPPQNIVCDRENVSRQTTDSTGVWFEQSQFYADVTFDGYDPEDDLLLVSTCVDPAPQRWMVAPTPPGTCPMGQTCEGSTVITPDVRCSSGVGAQVLPDGAVRISCGYRYRSGNPTDGVVSDQGIRYAMVSVAVR